MKQHGERVLGQVRHVSARAVFEFSERGLSRNHCSSTYLLLAFHC